MKKLILLSVLVLGALVSGSAQGPALYVNPALTVGRIIVPWNINFLVARYQYWLQIAGDFTGTLAARMDANADAEERLSTALDEFQAHDPDFYNRVMTACGCSVRPRQQ